ERVEKFTFSLSGTLLTFWNRRMRTRMYGGVRGRGLAAPSYSIQKRFDFKIWDILSVAKCFNMQFLATMTNIFIG
ncbi:hypothetical protein, partial [Paenibacillus antibioticophila]|uniref:hypothetical protein n=1 Tax=Paenibacillus antibioticophila TaxID=1274374 RepID=UPI001BB45069